jgi:hypothetical protein
MRQAFSEIARILFDSGLLTIDLLEEKLRLLLCEVAIAGSWLGRYGYHATKETRSEIFPGYFGHASAWERLRDRFATLFAVDTAEWKSKLLEAEADQTAPSQDLAFDHAEDYSWVKFNGKLYRLGPIAARVVEALDAADQRGEPGMKGARLLEIAGAPDTSRLRDFFRNTGVWNTLIVSPQKGWYRLNLQPSPAVRRRKPTL